MSRSFGWAAPGWSMQHQQNTFPSTEAINPAGSPSRYPSNALPRWIATRNPVMPGNLMTIKPPEPSTIQELAGILITEPVRIA